MTFNQGDKVKVSGERGLYTVKTGKVYADGSLLIFGGSTNPNGIQRFRSVQPERLTLVPVKRTRKGNAEV